MSKYKAYQRSIDAGHGVQTLIFRDGVCISQDIGPGYEQYHSYTGDGNPEFVGMTVRQIGMARNRFKIVRGNRADNLITWYFEGQEEQYRLENNVPAWA